ncbi:MAG: DUF4271 domain-containing protein [Bacteroidales bacterium]|nr:DUF4271 domain-containing protein [Bacteroidales bacterium]
MDTTGQQTLLPDFFLKPVSREPLPETDSIQGYGDFLVDSLNQSKPDSTFIFELKDIILPEQDIDSSSNKVIYDKPSLFSTVRKQPQPIKPEVRVSRENDWLTALFMICLVLITWIRYYNFRRIKQLFKAVIGRHHVNQLVRDGNLVEERITPGLVIIYLTGLSVIIYQLGLNTIYEKLGYAKPWLIFTAIIAGISILWFIKLLTIKFTGIIFRTKQDTSELILTNLIFNGAAGIIIFPFVVAGFYSGNLLLIKIAALILLMGMAFRFFRSLVIGLTAQTFSVIYLFLYLCTLEILPLLILYRMASGAD